MDTYSLIIKVALRKESVDRNYTVPAVQENSKVALRKESVDRNGLNFARKIRPVVALRKESVDRNYMGVTVLGIQHRSLSARRAWIEIKVVTASDWASVVALRKESVDRNKWALAF